LILIHCGGFKRHPKVPVAGITAKYLAASNSPALVALRPKPRYPIVRLWLHKGIEMRLLRSFAFISALAVVSACQTNDLKEPPVPLGDFALGLNIAVADNVQKVPISRDASKEEWQAAIIKAVDDRFGRYEGSKAYNIGISIDAYALAPPGVPLVLSPKSILVVTANIWDDKAAKKLNPEGKQLTIFEHMSAGTALGSGLTQTKEQQMETLSYNAAKAVEKWLLDHPDWFGIETAVKPVKPKADAKIEADAEKSPK
jgi:hypothetical protein